MAPGNEGLTPGSTATPTLTVEALVTALRELQGTRRAPPSDRYRLSPAIFGGKGDVEQFIREFQDVAIIAEWPAQVRVLQLRACLTGRAKSFALGPDEEHILRGLRTRFGLTTEEASDCLQALRRDRRTSLEDHANEVERLAQAVFSQATGPERERLVYNAFFRSVNNADVQHHWMAAKVSSLEEALEMGKAYFQVEELKGARFTAYQVVRNETTTPSNPQVAAATTKSPEQTQLTMLMDMVKGLQATVTELQQGQVGRRALRVRDNPTRPSQLICWGCGTPGHVRRHCPKGKLPLKIQGSW